MSTQDSAQDSAQGPPTRAQRQASPHDVIGVGAAFLFAGLTCFVRARAGLDDRQSDLPDDAPRSLKVSYRLFAVGAAGSLAIIGTWVAIGSGPRAFNIATPYAEMQTTGELVGRTVFALGATIAWILVFALAVGAVRALFDRRGA
jgi:hypothetical protein